MIPLALLLTLAASTVSDDGTALSLADLPSYRAALAPHAGGKARPVTFRDLWDRPDVYRGRRVRVTGQVARRFHQPAAGDFPPLAEVWIVSAPGDPLCLIYPEPAGVPSPGPGVTVNFSGVFLKRLRYKGGDGDRLAPLILGDRPPTPVPMAPLDTWGSLPVRWALGIGAAMLASAILLSRHLARPPRRLLELGPPLEWIDPNTSTGANRLDPGADPSSRPER